MVELLFYVFSAIAIGSALGVVIQKNPVGSLLFMVSALGSLAGIFVLFEAHFLAAIQVMVYAGAIMVLFLFVIMLLNLGHEYRQDLKLGLVSLPAFAISGVFAWFLVRSVRGEADAAFLGGFDAGPAMDVMLARDGAVGVIALPLFRDYVVPFELTGILLLVAVVGAIALAKKKV